MLLTAMSPGPTFDRVYAALKAQLLDGRWPPGARLEPATLGDDLSASITPVRDALHRLVGERLVEAPRHDGFWVPAMSEAQLRELYAWNGAVLGWALRHPPAGSTPAAGEPAGDEIGTLFLEIARGAQNGELEQAIASNNDRLAAFRLAEARAFEDLAGELASLQLCLRDGDVPRLRRELGAYHRRRHRAAPLILATLRREAGRHNPG